MLDTDTKRRIDTARDILVGKVPDPKSQVEQITIALIYKFMDDMDAESEEFGGKRKFFTKEFARYGWAKLMRSGLGGHETLNLYAEAIAKMPENPGIPPLFRDIFKNAYLPYRDPETLRAFLKIIDEFNYDHSERLGDAFEYLLSVLGSQGDAGQFRTPRHIIDFMVEVIDPKKTETVLDPACGTAGFLISSYKHILQQNTSPRPLGVLRLPAGEGVGERAGDLLTPDDKGRLAQNFKGYDISPDMVRLSLVNLYLHGFADPHIAEYDCLTSQERWHEHADVILANPPFMSPKGGIRPHNRFSVQSKRSEVLFVDYKVNNDGFGLGAQRREIDKNDLPAAAGFLKSWFQSIQSPASMSTLSTPNALLVEKEKIAANGDYNLSGERYRENGTRTHAFPLVRIGDLCILNPRKSQLADLPSNTRISFVPMAALNEHQIAFQPLEEKKLSEVSASYTYFEDNDVLLAKVTPCFENGKAGIARGLLNGLGFGSSEFYVFRPTSQVLPEWIYFCVTHPFFRDAAIAQMTGTGGLQRVPKSYVENFEIPLPPLEMQKEIVVEIEGYQKVINGARAVLDHYRPHIPIHPDWPMVPIGEACIVNPRKSEVADLESSTVVSFIPMSDIGEHEMFFAPKDTKRLDEVTTSYTYFKDGDVLLAKVTPCFENGKAGIARELRNGIGFGSSEFYVLRPTGDLLAQWVFMFAATPAFRAWATPQMTGTGGLQRVPRPIVESYQIPLPHLAIQQTIVAEIEAEQALVAANRELITRFEKKIQTTLARVWGETA